MVISNKEINFSVLFWYCWYFCAGTGGQWIPPPILSFLIFLEQNFGKYRFVLPVLPGIGTIWGALLGCKTTMARRAHCVPLDCGPQEGRLSCDSWDLALPGTLLTCFRLIVKEQLARNMENLEYLRILCNYFIRNYRYQKAIRWSKRARNAKQKN